MKARGARLLLAIALLPVTSLPGRAAHVVPELPCVRHAGGCAERLAGVLRDCAGVLRWGWTERQIYRSEDGGASWLVASDSPDGPIEGMILQNDAIALLGSRAGRLFRSVRPLREWQEATEVFDRLTWSRNTPESSAVPSPLGCLSTADEGEVTLEFAKYSCFSSGPGQLRLAWTPDATTVVGDVRLVANVPNETKLTLDTRTSAKVRSELARIAERGGEGPACGSTTSLTVHVSWRCGAEPLRHLHVAASYCGSGNRPSLTRAFRLRDLARDLTQR